MQKETTLKRDDTYLSTNSKVRTLRWALLNDFVCDPREHGKIYLDLLVDKKLQEISVGSKFMSQIDEVENIKKINGVYNAKAQKLGISERKPDDKIKTNGDYLVASREQEYEDEYYVAQLLSAMNQEEKNEYITRLRARASLALAALTEDSSFKPEVAQSLAVALTTPEFKAMDNVDGKPNPALDFDAIVRKYGLTPALEELQPGA